MKNLDKMAVAKRIEEVRTDTGFPQWKFVEVLREHMPEEKLSLRGYGNYSTGKRPLPLTMIKALYHAFSVSCRWLVTGTGEKYYGENGEIMPLRKLDTRLLSLEPGVFRLPFAESCLDANDNLKFRSYTFSLSKLCLDRARVNPEDAIVMETEEDCCIPKIPAGSLTCLDISIRQVESAGVFALVREQKITLRHVTPLSNRWVLLSREGPSSSPTAEKVKMNEMFILGKVVWCDRVLE